MIPIISPEPLPLLGKIVIAVIVIVGLFFLVRAYIRNGRL
jgi:hypothetical protein